MKARRGRGKARARGLTAQGDVPSAPRKSVVCASSVARKSGGSAQRPPLVPKALRVAGVRMEKSIVPITWMMSVAASLLGFVAKMRTTSIMTAIMPATKNA